MEMKCCDNSNEIPLEFKDKHSNGMTPGSKSVYLKLEY